MLLFCLVLFVLYVFGLLLHGVVLFLGSLTLCGFLITFHIPQRIHYFVWDLGVFAVAFFELVFQEFWHPSCPLAQAQLHQLQPIGVLFRKCGTEWRRRR